MESICHHLWSGCDKTLLQDLQGQRSRSHWKLQGCGVFQVLAQRSAPCSSPYVLPACCSVHISVLTHGHASLRPRDRPCLRLSQLRATQGSQELARLRLGGKLRAVGSTAHLTSFPVPDRLPEQHTRASCRACEGQLWREMTPHLLCPSQASVCCPSWAPTPPGPGSVAAFCQTLPEAPTLQGCCKPVGTRELR